MEIRKVSLRQFTSVITFITLCFTLPEITQSYTISKTDSHNTNNINSNLLSELKTKLRKVPYLTPTQLNPGFDFHKPNDEEIAELLVKQVIPSYLTNLLQNSTQRAVLFDKVLQPRQDQPEDQKCLEHVGAFLGNLVEIVSNPTEILNASTWALQMIDSWGKAPTEGILSGHVNAYGDYDECVDIGVDVYNQEEDISSDFRGQYCWIYAIPTSIIIEGGDSSDQMGYGSLLDVRQPGVDIKKAGTIPELIENILNPLTTFIMPSNAFCVPSSCSAEKVQELSEAMFSLLFPNTLPFVSFCETSEKPPLSKGAKVMIGVLSVLALFILIGSTLDVVLSNNRTKFHEAKKLILVNILLAFSLPTNIKKWQNTKSGDGGFGCVHGIRFFSTCWVLLSHTVFILTMQGPVWNSIDVNRIYDSHWSMYFLLNGFFSVDTFFTMSGFLACYSILNALDKSGGRLNVLKLYLHRYLRLTPTYALIIGVLATLFPYCGSGPYFTQFAEASAGNCQKFWWHNLLYANNLVYYNGSAGENMCEGESWYIANDMQFFILSPIFVFLLWKWKLVGMAVLAAASVASILAPGIVVGTEKLPPTQIFWKAGSSPNPRLMDVYFHPWYRIGPYLVGIWFGYFLFKIGKKPVKLNKILVIGGWMLSTSVALALILGVIPYYDPKNEDNAIGAGFYAGLSKFCWGIVICWVIFACIKGYGGWVNSLLSCKVFIPLGRLTFCVYLSSLSVQTLLHLTLRQPMVFDMYHLTNMFFAHLIMCFLVGFVLTMTFESPFIVLEKVVFGIFERAPVRESKRETEDNGISDSKISTIPRVKAGTCVASYYNNGGSHNNNS